MKSSKTWYVVILILAFVIFSGISQGQMRSGKLGVGVGGSLYLFNSNISDGLLKAGGGASLSYSIMENLGIRAMFGAGQLGWKDKDNPTLSNTTSLYSGNIYLSYDMIPQGTINPFVFVGLGGIYFDPRSDLGPYLAKSTTDKVDLNYLGGVGFDYFFSEFVSMTISGEFALTNTDKLDMQKHMGTNDTYSRINLEFRYYFFDQDYVTKLIQALQARYKGK